MSIFLIDPDAQLDFSINWDDGYLSTGESINTTTWTVFPSTATSTQHGISIVGSTKSTDSKITTITVNGASHGIMYHLTNKVVTTASRTDERTIFVKGWEPI